MSGTALIPSHKVPRVTLTTTLKANGFSYPCGWMRMSGQRVPQSPDSDVQLLPPHRGHPLSPWWPRSQPLCLTHLKNCHLPAAGPVCSRNSAPGCLYRRSPMQGAAAALPTAHPPSEEPRLSCSSDSQGSPGALGSLHSPGPLSKGGASRTLGSGRGLNKWPGCDHGSLVLSILSWPAGDPVASFRGR